MLAVAGSWFAFSHFRLLLDPIYPSLAAITMYIAIERTLRVASDKEKKFVRQAFGQYLAPELLARLESSPKAMELGGEAREITVMFMDVRGFTPISEKLSATELVDFINTLLGPLTQAIQSELGTIDKYIGDSIMAFWNAPLDIADHPMHACRAALKMREAVRQLNEDDAFGFEGRGISGAEVKIGVGLNFGIAAVGNMGSEIRFNYSAMGDVVNVAARIEVDDQGIGRRSSGLRGDRERGQGRSAARGWRNPAERQIAADQAVCPGRRRDRFGNTGVCRAFAPAQPAAAGARRGRCR